MTDWIALDGAAGVLPADAGRALTVFGNPFLLKVSGAESHGAVALLTASFAAGTGAKEHWHRGHDEIFYVLDGEFRFRVGDEYLEATTGGLCFAPRRAAHGFQNIGSTPGRLLGVIAPAGYEQHFVDIDGITPGPDTHAVLAEIFAKYDQEPAAELPPRGAV